MSQFKIVLAGVVGLPCILASAILVAPLLAVLSIPPLLLLLFRSESSNAALPDQVIIAGGSSGIGLCIAKECVRRGIPKITLIARNLDRLKEAQAELEALAAAFTTITTSKHDNDNNKKNVSQIHIVSVSVSDYEALSEMARELKIPITDRVVLWNCAGFSYPAEFDKVPIAKFEQQVMTNQLGTIYLVRAFLPHLKEGLIVLTSSAAGQLGVYGYTSYAPTKYAIRGFAETLHAELIRSHPRLGIQLAFPMDTDTPGYQEELKTVPAITRKLSENTGLSTPDQTGKAMVDAAFTKNPKFQVYFSFEGWMLANVTAGLSPVTTLGDAVTQVALGGLLRLIALFHLNDWWNVIRTYPGKEGKAD